VVQKKDSALLVVPKKKKHDRQVGISRNNQDEHVRNL